MSEKVKPINFSEVQNRDLRNALVRERFEENIVGSEFVHDPKTNKDILTITSGTLKGKTLNENTIEIKKHKRSLKKDRYEIFIFGEQLGWFDAREEWQEKVPQYVYDLVKEFTNMETDKVMGIVNHEIKTKSELHELHDDVANIDTSSQTTAEIAAETENLAEKNLKEQEKIAAMQDRFIEKLTTLTASMEKLNTMTYDARVEAKIDEVSLLIADATTIQRALRDNTLPIGTTVEELPDRITTIREAEEILKNLQDKINTTAEEIKQIYTNDENINMPQALDQFLDAVLGLDPEPTTPGSLFTPARESHGEGSKGGSAGFDDYSAKTRSATRIEAVKSKAVAVPFDISLLQRYGGQSAEDYFATLGYDQSHMTLLKRQLGHKDFNKKMEEAAEELMKFHQVAHDIQQEYITQGITIRPFALLQMKDVPDKHKDVKELLGELHKHNSKIYKLTRLKDDKRDAISPYNPDPSRPTRASERRETILMGKTRAPSSWADYYGAKYINEALVNRGHAGVDSKGEKYLFGLTGRTSPDEVFEYVVQQDKVIVRRHYKRMSAKQLIALYNVSEHHENFDEENEKILKRTLIKRLLGVAASGRIQDRRGRDQASPFEDMIVLLGSENGNPGTLEKGKERFWKLLKESYIDEKYGDAIASDVNAEYTRLQAIADAMHGQDLQNRNLHLVADQMGFENPISEDALLTNAFIRVMSKRLEVPQRNIKMIFSLNKKDSYETAGEIRNIMKIDSKEVKNWQVFKDKGLSRGVRHVLYKQVAAGNMKLSTADKLANATEIVTSVGKVITGGATLWSLGKAAVQGARGSLKWAFTFGKGDYKQNFDNALKNLKAAGVRGIAYAGVTALDSGFDNYYQEFMPKWLKEYGDIAYGKFKNKMYGEELELQQALESGIGTGKIPMEYLVGKSVSSMRLADLKDRGVIIEDNNRLRIDKDALLELPGTDALRGLLNTQGGEMKLRLLLNYISDRIIQKYGTTREDVANHPGFSSLILADAVNTTPEAPDLESSLPDSSTSAETSDSDGSSDSAEETETTESTPEGTAVLDAELRAIGLGKTQTEIEAMSADEQTEYYTQSAFAMQQWNKLFDDSNDSFNEYFDMTQLEVVNEDGTIEKITVNNFRARVEEALDQKDTSGISAKEALKAGLEKVINGEEDAVTKYFDLITQVFGADDSYMKDSAKEKFPLYSSKKMPDGAKSLAAYLADPHIGNSNGKGTLYMDNPTLGKGLVGNPVATVGGVEFDSSKHKWSDLL